MDIDIDKEMQNFDERLEGIVERFISLIFRVIMATSFTTGNVTLKLDELAEKVRALAQDKEDKIGKILEKVKQMEEIIPEEEDELLKQILKTLAEYKAGITILEKELYNLLEIE